MTPAYYNEIDAYCVRWLRNLIDAGHLPPGDVDDRDIKKVQPDDLKGYGQVHLFAGIGGFGLGLRLAGWPDDRPIWTGGYPCQPFSVAGKQGGEKDDRHLWPKMYRLLDAIRPDWVLGENVAGHITMGLDGVLSDLEGSEYTCRTFAIPACAVDAPHRRERVWIAAHGESARGEARRADTVGTGRGSCGDAGQSASPRSESPVARTPRTRQSEGRPETGGPIRHKARRAESERRSGPVADAPSDNRRPRKHRTQTGTRPDAERRRGLTVGGEDVGNADRTGREQQRRPVSVQPQLGPAKRGGGEDVGNATERRLDDLPSEHRDEQEQRDPQQVEHRGTGGSDSFWSDHAIIGGRRVKPGVRLLAHGIPQRVAKLRAFGNAVVPQVVAEIAKAIQEADGVT